VVNPYIGLKTYWNRAAVEMGFRIPYHPFKKVISLGQSCLIVLEMLFLTP
jgi:hypothetical protein